jgi:hypothetical protein
VTPRAITHKQQPLAPARPSLTALYASRRERINGKEH